VFTGKARDAHHSHESPPVMTIPLVILALLAAFLGFIGLPGLPRNIHSFLEPAAELAQGINLSLLLQSNGLAIAGILVAFLVYRRSPAKDPLRRALGPVHTALAHRLYVDEFYMLVIRGLFFTTSKAVAWFDRHVVDGVVNLVGGASQAGGRVLRKTLTGKVQSYALIVLCAVAAALAFVAARGGLK